MSTFPLSPRWLMLPLMMGLILPSMAGQHEPFIDGNLTAQDDVVVLNNEESAEFFDAVIEIDSLSEDAFELVIESPPSFLEPLEKGWRLVAATDTPHRPLGNTEWQLANSGLLARVIAIETDDDHLLRLSLEHAELEAVVEDGTLTLIAVERVTSADEDFPIAELQGHATPATWRWLPATFEEQGWAPCPAEETAVRQENTFYFNPQVSADIHYQATLALKRQLTFEGGRLIDAQMEGRLCQGAEITPRFEEGVNKEKTIWTRRKGPYYRLVGAIPIMFSVNASLSAKLDSSARLSTRDPIRLHHDSAGGLRWQDEQWHPLPSHSHHQGPELPALALDASIDASFSLKPRLALILYGSAGPYLEANATMHATWQPMQTVQGGLSLTLFGGLTHRKGLWGDDWVYSALNRALYRWPEE